MRKILFIINPVAGQRDNKKFILPIQEFFQDEEVKIVISNEKDEIKKIAQKFLVDGYTDFIAIGGDGTFSEMINGLNRKSVRIGIIPAGTGNDFAKSIDMPSSIDSCLKIIKEMETIDIDVGKINNEKFINVACFGIDGQIIRDTEIIKKYIPGSLSYLLSTIKAIIFYRAAKISLKIDDYSIEKNTILIAVGNGKFIGSGMKVTPLAKLNDGYFDLCLVEKMNKVKLLKTFPKIFKGTHIDEEKVLYLKCKKIIVESNSNRKVNINSDGNLRGYLPAEIEILEKYFNLIVPKSTLEENKYG